MLNSTHRIILVGNHLRGFEFENKVAGGVSYRVAIFVSIGFAVAVTVTRVSGESSGRRA
jgi:hypothetical protein